jgi:hypothetical protein
MHWRFIARQEAGTFDGWLTDWSPDPDHELRPTLPTVGLVSTRSFPSHSFEHRGEAPGRFITEHIRNLC